MKKDVKAGLHKDKNSKTGPAPESTFASTRWAKSKDVLNYLEHADILVPERSAFRSLLKSFFSHYLGTKKDIRLLDLGSGDGAMVSVILDVLAPGVMLHATLVDASTDMLKKAKENLSERCSLELLEMTLEHAALGGLKEEGVREIDLCVSSLAIHHLITKDKATLYNAAFGALAPGGYIINMDTTLAPSVELEEFYATLREEDSLKAAKEKGINISTLDDIINWHKNPEHHSRLDTLETQLEMLKRAGFIEVDCFYKKGVFSAFGGMRPK